MCIRVDNYTHSRRGPPAASPNLGRQIVRDIHDSLGRLHAGFILRLLSGNLSAAPQRSLSGCHAPILGSILPGCPSPSTTEFFRGIELCVEPHPRVTPTPKKKLLPLPSLAPFQYQSAPQPHAIAQIRRSPLMKKPVSNRQLAANRANAAQSTGPRSPEVKSLSAQNSRKHGFTASTFAVVRLEDIDEVAHLRDDAIASYQPVNSQELFAIERIALSRQALLRVERLHAGISTTFLNEALSGDGKPLMGISDSLVNGDNEITKAQNRNYLFAEGFHRINKYSNSFTLFLRYRPQTERLYRRAIDEFDRLKALRHELPNEPILEAQPEANETVSTPEPNPSNPANPSPAGNIPEI